MIFFQTTDYEIPMEQNWYQAVSCDKKCISSKPIELIISPKFLSTI